jgi:hypothetical protein
VQNKFSVGERSEERTYAQHLLALAQVYAQLLHAQHLYAQHLHAQHLYAHMRICAAVAGVGVSGSEASTTSSLLPTNLSCC